ncbi:hypothetical protein [Kitasatospora azatica]|uniref:hypothetical protein n=1 Tax=Kitasatospora azatica TaxID=58347 RepID=UPI00055FEE46|nr:hypothetical protein [Kitasatospora azatica]
MATGTSTAARPREAERPRSAAAAPIRTGAPNRATAPIRTGALSRLRAAVLGSTPRQVRTLTVTALTTVLVFAAVVGTVLSGTRDSTDAIGLRAAPQAVRAADLYFALSDLDAQAANLLLVGADQDHFAQRKAVSDLYNQRRAQADADLEQATEAAAGDPGARRTVSGLLDALGQYEALVARSDLQETVAKAAPGQPPADALVSYQQATDLLRQELLPAADQVAGDNEATVTRIYAGQRADLGKGRTWLLVTGLLALGALGALQRTLTVRYRRRVSPPLVGALLLTAIGLGYGLTLAADAQDQLHTAKANAYDSVIALGRARAVAYDSNADESRWLVDHNRAAAYQQSFFDKTQQIVRLDGTTLNSYDDALAKVVDAHRASPRVLGFTGYLGDELRNVTFPGEQQAADRVLTAFQTYQRDDRRIRVLQQQGRLGEAIAFDTGTAEGQSNGDFAQLSDAFDKVIAINQQAFDRTVRQSDAELGAGAAVWLALLVAGTLALTVLAVRPRLREYR